jgi:hypothetical protein
MPGRWEMFPERYQRHIALLLLTIQPLVFFRHVLFFASRRIPYDLETFHLPLATYIARCVRERTLPLWDPYPYCGVPIHADITAQLFYPFTWLAIFLGNLSAGRGLYYWLEWLNPLHMILGGWFTFLLLRAMGNRAPAALIGGTVYQLGAFFASQAEHLGAICCGAWLPLVLLAVFKLYSNVTWKWIAALGLALALSVLSGFPATTLVVFVAGAIFAAGLILTQPKRVRNRDFFGALLAGLVLGSGIAAVQIVPTLQLARLSIASMRYQWLATGSGLVPQSMVSLVIPNYYHILTLFDPSGLPIDFTFLYVYCGVIPLVLLLAAPFLRRVPYAKMLFACSVISAIWMLGNTTPFYALIYTLLPRLVMSAMYCQYALLAFCMFVSLTAAIALQRISARAPKWVPWCLALLTAADLTFFGADRPMDSAPGNYRQEHSEQEINGYPGALRKIQRLTASTVPPLRIDYLDTDTWIFILASDIFKLPTADGDSAFMLQRIYRLRRLFCAAKNVWDRDIPVSRLDSPLVSMLNTGFLAGRSAFPSGDAGAGLKFIGEIAGLRFYQAPDPLPRFYLVHGLHIVRDPDEAFAYLAQPSFHPAEEAVVETEDPLPASAPGGGSVRVERYSANRVEVHVVASDRAFLVTSEVLYPGWRVSVNGAPARFYMTNGAFRGIALNKGANQIVMTYWPPRFFVWMAISLASTLAALGGAIFDYLPFPLVTTSRQKARPTSCSNAIRHDLK